MSYRLVADGIKYAIIALVQARGLYHQEVFLPYNWHGNIVHEIFEPAAAAYLKSALETIKTYLAAQNWIRVVTTIYNPQFQPVERWEYNVRAATESPGDPMALIRNVKGTAAFTRCLDPNYTFKILVYVDPELERLPQLTPAADPHIEHPNGYACFFPGSAGPWSLGVKFEASDD